MVTAGMKLKDACSLGRNAMTTGKTIALTIQTFVSKVMSLLFNTLSRLVIAFLPRNKHLLLSLSTLRACKYFKTYLIMHVSMALEHPLNQFFVLESTRLSLTSDMQMTPPLWQKSKKN